MLGQEIKKELPSTTLVISQVITGNDHPNLNVKIKELNTKLSQVCSNNKWKFISHNNISTAHLNPHGLHLNRQGTTELANNFKYFLNNYDWLSKYNNTSCETAVTYDRQQNSVNQSILILPKTRGFKLSSLNVGSLKKYIDEVKVLLFDTSIDVLAINEIRLDSTIACTWL